MSKKWIVEIKGGWHQAKKRVVEYDIRLQNTKVFEWWDYKKNKDRPENYPPRSNQKAWFKCDVGHSFNTKISIVFDATKKLSGGCNICGSRIKYLKDGNTIENKFPELIKNWVKEKNHGLPKDYSPHSIYKAWWYCSTCNSSFKRRIDSITSKQKVYCDKCKFIYLPDKFPQLKKIWDTEKNIEKFNEVKAINNPKSYWWKCVVHGSVESSIYRAVRNNYCEKCVTVSKTSEIEIRLYFELKTIFSDIINQKTINKRQVDLFLPEEKIAIEFDGYPWHLGKEKKDLEKTKIIKKQNIEVLRIRDEQLINQNFPEAILIKKSEYMNPIKVIIKLLTRIKSYVKDSNKIIKINQYIENKKLINEDEYNKARAKFSLADTDRSLSILKKVCKYFDYKKNFPLTPKHFTQGSHQKVWWLCKNGHSKYLRIVQFRQHSYDEKLDKMKCTRCDLSRRSMNPTKDVKNGVLHNYPNIYYQYDKKKNGKVLRSDVSYQSNKYVWWKCDRDNSSWQAHIWQRTVGDIKHCPKCEPISWKRTAKKIPEKIKELPHTDP